MFRKVIKGNISNDEYDKYGSSHSIMCSKYLEHYVIADYIAFYLANGYYHSSLWESSFMQHFNSAADMFNLSFMNKDKVIEDTKRALKIKYSLEIIEEKPILKVKEI